MSDHTREVMVDTSVVHQQVFLPMVYASGPDVRQNAVMSLPFIGKIYI